MKYCHPKAVEVLLLLLNTPQPSSWDLLLFQEESSPLLRVLADWHTSEESTETVNNNEM